NEESLLTQMGAVRLRTELDRIPLWAGNHVGIRQLSEYMARYLYLPRLRDEQVLIAAIRDGVNSPTWRDDGFAYAESWDESRNRYQGLKCGTSARVIVDDRAVLVKAEVAIAQLASDNQTTAAVTANSGSDDTDSTRLATELVAETNTSANYHQPSAARRTPPAQPPVPKLSRFHGSIRLDPLRTGRDASRIAEEVIQHLTGLVGAEVEITLEIQAKLPDGVSEKLVRDVTENCRTLKFGEFGFEEA
ncbi:MAG: AAA+ family ATPase, partial [Planctomycetaceae bacterium]